MFRPHPIDAALAVEEEERLDPLVRAFGAAIPAGLTQPPLRDWLEGDWLGHALHPMLTDLPLGMWMSASVLDVLAPRRWRAASTTLTGLGVLLALPTIASGLVEWRRAAPRQQRVGVVHAALNTTATVCYATSFLAKARGRRRRGVLYGLAGGIAASVGGYLGGHLSFARGVGVDGPGQGRGHARPSVRPGATGMDVGTAAAR
ncbi:DUF2231 domain-containing protein [Egicoccus sp. AB-alg6-2]|uniref:DUF2231 domain-containing protein n=1 Tax=Egicoccus sp. AB-alg6-2 TaxID=3242692 RepID=UPI00359E7CCB